MIRKIAQAACLTTLLAACASPTQKAEKAAALEKADTPVKVMVTVPFNEAQARAAMQPGTHQISGVLFHKIANNAGRNTGSDPLLLGHSKTMANVNIQLYPASDHLLEAARLNMENSKARVRSKTVQLTHYVANPAVFNYMRKTTTNKHGLYVFDNLQPGRYFLQADTQEVITTGTETVEAGRTTVTNGLGIYAGTGVHTQTQNYRVKTTVDYEEVVEIKPGQTELKLESRMTRITPF